MDFASLSSHPEAIFSPFHTKALEILQKEETSGEGPDTSRTYLTLLGVLKASKDFGLATTSEEERQLLAVCKVDLSNDENEKLKKLRMEFDGACRSRKAEDICEPKSEDLEQIKNQELLLETQQRQINVLIEQNRTLLEAAKFHQKQLKTVSSKRASQKELDMRRGLTSGKVRGGTLSALGGMRRQKSNSRNHKQSGRIFNIAIKETFKGGVFLEGFNESILRRPICPLIQGYNTNTTCEGRKRQKISIKRLIKNARMMLETEKFDELNFEQESASTTSAAPLGSFPAVETTTPKWGVLRSPPRDIQKCMGPINDHIYRMQQADPALLTPPTVVV